MTELKPRGWLISYSFTGKPHTIFSGHNCVGDYQHFYSNATAEAVYTCGPELLAALTEYVAAHAVPSSTCKERPAYDAAIAAIAEALGEVTPIVKTLSDVPESDFCDCNDAPDEEEQAFNKCKACGGRFP